MKKILTILFVLSSVISFGQGFPNQLNAYNPKTQINILGAVANDSGLVFRYNFPDTVTANLGWIKNVPNIFVVIDDTLRKRSNDATRWMTVGSGSGGGGGNTIYTGDGSYPLNAVRAIDQNGGSTSFINGNVGIGVAPTSDEYFVVSDGGNSLLQFSKTFPSSTMRATDGIGLSTINLGGNPLSGYQFTLEATDAVNDVTIFGDAVANTVTLTSTSTFISNLATGGSAPATTGTRQGLITDANGLLSFTNKTFAALTFGATTTWDYSTGYNKSLTLTGDANLVFTNLQDGDYGTLIVFQDGSGGHALTVPDQVININTDAGDTTVLGFTIRAGFMYWTTSVVAASGVTSVSGTTNRITSTGGTTPVIDISASYVGQSSIVTLGNVTSGGLGTGAVVRGVTMTLGSDATGDIYYRNVSGVLTRLGVGTSKQTLHGGTNPQWLDTAASASGLTIGSTTITSGTNGRVLYDNSGVVGEMTTTGSGTVLALATSAVLVTPTLGVATATSINGNTFTTGTYTLTGQAGKTLTFNGSITLTGTDAQTYTFPGASQTIASLAGTETLTNKRWTARVGNTTSSATPTINTDNTDIYKLTAQAADITSFTTNLSGTPVDGDFLEIEITGTAARAITWGASFVSSTFTLPLTTVTTATLTVVFQYFTTSSYGNNKWVCVNAF